MSRPKGDTVQTGFRITQHVRTAKRWGCHPVRNYLYIGKKGCMTHASHISCSMRCGTDLCWTCEWDPLTEDSLIYSCIYPANLHYDLIEHCHIHIERDSTASAEGMVMGTSSDINRPLVINPDPIFLCTLEYVLLSSWSSTHLGAIICKRQHVSYIVRRIKIAWWR